MKKVLILTTSTGQGHNQAAASVENAFKSHGYTTIKYDFLARNSKLLNNIIVYGYEFLASKFSFIYGLLYNLSDTKFTNKLLKLPFYLNSRKFYKKVDELKPDLIVASHAFSINVMRKFKKVHPEIPYILIVTDFKAHSTYIDHIVDAYVTGSNYTKNNLIKTGITPDKIYPIGIPINERFYKEKTSAEELKDDYFNLLLMSGSLGLDSISLVLKQLLKNKNKLRITVVCGKNEKLKKNLINYCSNYNFSDKKLHILGYTTDIAYLMDYCDLIISKPGGLTVTESIVKNIPLIIPFSIPGQEQENTDFLVGEGYSISIDSIDNINNVVNYYINNPEDLTNIKNKLKSLSSSYSIEKIVYIGEDLLNKNDCRNN